MAHGPFNPRQLPEISNTLLGTQGDVVSLGGSKSVHVGFNARCLDGPNGRFARPEGVNSVSWTARVPVASGRGDRITYVRVGGVGYLVFMPGTSRYNSLWPTYLRLKEQISMY